MNKYNKLEEKNKILEKFPSYLNIINSVLRITVYVKTNVKKDEIEFNSEEFFVKTTSPPTKGKANKSIINQLADFFNISKTMISIKLGHKSHEKVFDIHFKNREEMQNSLQRFKIQ